MKKIAIITARSGSKGLPDKNILHLCGKPMMAYTIEAALQSKEFDSVLVSTDSEEYAAIARHYGADVPFLRSQKNATDTASSWDVVRETLYRLQEQNQYFDIVTLLQPTSPLRDYRDIQGAMELYRKTDACTVVSICEVSHPTEWCFHIKDNYSMEEYAKEPSRNARRQDIPKQYMENGAIYITDVSKLMQNTFDIYLEKCFGYIMSREHSYDIDNKIDMIVAEAILSRTST